MTSLSATDVKHRCQTVSHFVTMCTQLPQDRLLLSAKSTELSLLGESYIILLNCWRKYGTYLWAPGI